MPCCSAADSSAHRSSCRQYFHLRFCNPPGITPMEHWQCTSSMRSYTAASTDVGGWPLGCLTCDRGGRAPGNAHGEAHLKPPGTTQGSMKKHMESTQSQMPEMQLFPMHARVGSALSRQKMRCCSAKICLSIAALPHACAGLFRHQPPGSPMLFRPKMGATQCGCLLSRGHLHAALHACVSTSALVTGRDYRLGAPVPFAV
jgi:hypothetical protein